MLGVIWEPRHLRGTLSLEKTRLRGECGES